MSTHLTQLPIGVEYLRVFIMADEDGEMGGIKIYPLRQFSAPREKYHLMVREAYLVAEKLFKPDEPHRAIGYLNHAINQGIAELDSNGLVRHVKLKLQDHGYLQQVFQGNVTVETIDGYIIFNPTEIPPTPSPVLH
jgi:hypothetical protein